jgi:DNA-directed RNA polymerase subunit RPC12/RpoP
MTTFKIACPGCAASIRVPQTLAGKKIECPGCTQRILVPNPPRSKTILATVIEVPEPAKVAEDRMIVLNASTKTRGPNGADESTRSRSRSSFAGTASCRSRFVPDGRNREPLTLSRGRSAPPG